MLIIAEIGSTHDGSAGIARNSLAVAAACGANAVKFQTQIPEFETTRNAPAPLQGSKTILIVAHRLSTVEHCDRLYRLTAGRVTEAVVVGSNSEPTQTR